MMKKASGEAADQLRTGHGARLGVSLWMLGRICPISLAWGAFRPGAESWVGDGIAVAYPLYRFAFADSIALWKVALMVNTPSTSGVSAL